MTNLRHLLAALSFVALGATSTIAAMTGDHYCNSYMCAYFSLDSVKNTATITVATSASAGWVGLGFGSSMVGPELDVMWLARNNKSVVISRRRATSETLPQPVGNQSAVSLVTANSYVNNGQLMFSFVRPQVLPESTVNPSTMHFVWAYGLQKPSTDNANSTFTQHYNFGSFNLDLTKQLSNNNMTTPQFDSDPTDLDAMDYKVIAHATCMFIAWGILIPSGVFLARFGRKVDQWVNKHRIIQASALVFTIIGFGLGVSMDSDHTESPHQIIGITIFGAVCIQIFLGWLIHHLYNPNRTHRPIRNYIHIVFGFCLLILGYVNIPLGLELYGVSDIWLSAYYAWLFVQFIIFVVLTCMKVFSQRNDASSEEIHEKLVDTASAEILDDVQEPPSVYRQNPMQV